MRSVAERLAPPPRAMTITRRSARPTPARAAASGCPQSISPRAPRTVTPRRACPLPFAPSNLSKRSSKLPASVRSESSGCWTRTGKESELVPDIAGFAVGIEEDHFARVDVSAREPVGSCPSERVVEMALAVALSRAAEAGRWDVVVQRARELEARRLAAVSSVACLDDDRRKGDVAVTRRSEDAPAKPTNRRVCSARAIESPPGTLE
jgi:hypothetical protein